jgi:LytS/YehU family sensor histidine kinase
VPLRQELGFIRAYTEIQAVRLRDRLTVAWDIAPATLDAAIPIFVWQPILENAFRHGADPATGRVALEIGARREGTDLVFWIRDHGAGVGRGPLGPGAGSAPGQGIGLRNTRDRVTRLFGGSGSIEIGALEDGTVAVLRLPFAVYEGAPAPPVLP